MNVDRPGYHPVVIPDDTAGRPLTPGERAVIADLERRLLLDTAVPVRDRLAVARPVWARGSAPRHPAASPVVPLIALLATGVVMIVLLAAAGAGLLGMAAAVVSVVATALLWPLLPARLGGPVRPVPRQRRPHDRARSWSRKRVE